MSDFPPVAMTVKEDSSKFSVSIEDNTVRSEMEGGYEFTRPRTTRAPRKEFTTGFTHISESDRALLESFYLAQRAGASSFTYTDFTTSTEYTVRFVGEMKFKYVGQGVAKLWDVDGIKLRQV